MRRVIRLVGYTAAFTFVMPQITLALAAGDMSLTYLWYAVFIAAVEGSVAIFDMLARRETLNQLKTALPNEDMRDLINR